MEYTKWVPWNSFNKWEVVKQNISHNLKAINIDSVTWDYTHTNTYIHTSIKIYKDVCVCIYIYVITVKGHVHCKVQLLTWKYTGQGEREQTLGRKEVE